MTIAAGELRKQVKLQSVAYAPDANGERVATWTTFATSWMGIKSTPGKEQERAKNIVATQTHVGKMRYRPDVTTTIRILLGTRKFLVNSVVNVDEQNTELKVSMTEVVGQ